MNIIIFIIFFLLLKLKLVLSNNYVFDFKDSKIIELNNGNYLVFTENSIYAFDSDFNKILLNESSIINDFSFSNYRFPSLISKYPDEDTIIMISSYKLAILENNAFSHKTLNEHEFFILIPFEKENENFFILGYIQSSIFYIDYYKIDKEDLSLILKSNLHIFNNQISSKYYISCNIFNSINNITNLICSYLENKIIYIYLLQLGDEININSNETYLFNIDNDNDIFLGRINIEILKDSITALIYFFNSLDNSFN